MVPPVSLPLNFPTPSAWSPNDARIPATVRRAAIILRIEDSMSLPLIVGAATRHEKNGGTPDVDFPRSVAALHLTPKGLRGTVPGGLQDRFLPACGCDMRDFATSLKRLAVVGAALALSALAQPAL